MNYSDEVQTAINSAHDTAIANKILDMMQDLILKNGICSYRWDDVEEMYFILVVFIKMILISGSAIKE